MQFLPNDQRFLYALNYVLKHEGSYSDNAKDPGGETNYGITQKSLNSCYKRLGLPEDVKNLTRADVEKYYRSEWWNKYKYGYINSTIISAKVFDMAANMGAEEAHKLLQRALTHCGYPELKVDGILGQKTIYATNQFAGMGHEHDLKEEIIYEAKIFYKELTDEEPDLKIFLKGWLARAED